MSALAKSQAKRRCVLECTTSQARRVNAPASVGAYDFVDKYGKVVVRFPSFTMLGTNLPTHSQQHPLRHALRRDLAVTFLDFDTYRLPAQVLRGP